MIFREIKDKEETSITIEKEKEIMMLTELIEDVENKLHLKRDLPQLDQLTNNSCYYSQAISNITNFDKDDYKIWTLYSYLLLAQSV